MTCRHAQCKRSNNFKKKKVSAVDLNICLFSYFCILFVYGQFDLFLCFVGFFCSVVLEL